MALQRLNVGLGWVGKLTLEQISRKKLSLIFKEQNENLNHHSFL